MAAVAAAAAKKPRTVDQEQRGAIGNGRALIDVVDVKVVDGRLEVAKLVQFGLLRPPVKLVCPVVREIAHGLARGTGLPFGLLVSAVVNARRWENEARSTRVRGVRR